MVPIALLWKCVTAPSVIHCTCEFRNKTNSCIRSQLTHFSRSRLLFNKQLRGPISIGRFSLAGQSLQEQDSTIEVSHFKHIHKRCPSKRILISKSSIIAQSAKVVLNIAWSFPFKALDHLVSRGSKDKNVATSLYYLRRCFDRLISVAQSLSWSLAQILKRMLITCFHFDPSLSIPDSRTGKRV